MVKPFDPDAFIRRVGERLVREFTDAKAATTPSTIGTAAEQPVRNQLAQLLPRSITVGEGFVIDSYGGNQQATRRRVVRARHLPDTPQTTYYPCEGVIAVSDIKSSLDGTSLKDAFLRRAASTTDLPVHHKARLGI